VSTTRLTPLELAAGFPLPDAVAAPLPPSEARVEPLAAFQAVVRVALERPPCLVSFSGGRDSSAVLTVAADVARREGLPLPIPATALFLGSAESDESDWQEEVVRGLRLDDWLRVDVDDAFDCVGPVAQRILRRHGVLWPPNSHFHEPLLARAAGGSLLSGIGGDEVFGRSQWTRARAVLAGRARPQPRDVLRVGVALAPPRGRELALRRVEPPELPWLRPAALNLVIEQSRAEAAREPFSWRRRFGWIASLRYIRLGTESLELLARAHDVRLAHPFLDAGFLDGVAALPRRSRFHDRASGLERIFGRELPAARRETKARFDSVLWGSESQALAAAWEGEGVDRELVDVEALRTRWAAGAKGPHTLLQSIWLGRLESPSRGGDALDQLDCAL